MKMDTLDRKDIINEVRQLVTIHVDVSNKASLKEGEKRKTPSLYVIFSEWIVSSIIVYLIGICSGKPWIDALISGIGIGLFITIIGNTKLLKRRKNRSHSPIWYNSKAHGKWSFHQGRPLIDLSPLKDSDKIIDDAYDCIYRQQQLESRKELVNKLIESVILELRSRAIMENVVIQMNDNIKNEEVELVTNV